MNLLLFDIDGTLLNTSGSATRAADKAFEKFFKIKNIMDGIRTDGKTDPLILKEMFNTGLRRDYDENEAELLFEEYVNLLNAELLNGGKISLMPGIYELLSLLHNDENNLLGVATGNIEKGAWAKLQHSGLDKFFKFGGFGSDSDCREQLIRKAIQRSSDYCDRKVNKVYVIGDTPFDIIHGKASGAITVAVSTGIYKYGELEEYKPDYLFQDFQDNTGFLNIL